MTIRDTPSLGPFSAPVKTGIRWGERRKGREMEKELAWTPSRGLVTPLPSILLMGLRKVLDLGRFTEHLLGRVRCG